ncbi:MAG: nucleotidyltransferase [bacterium]|nr:nucleotidyltransferase [bacterium]
MKTVGIIAEYNPFHNGHQFHIEEARKLTGADRVVVVMSGDYVQRGEPAVIDKYVRTRMALEHGADAVFELPHYYALGSAEYFALGAISLLDKLGIIDSVCFGSECGEISKLREIANVLLEEPADYQSALKEALKEGLTFPAASAAAIRHYFHDDSISETISQPNNILGIYYMKALIKRSSDIVPYTLVRNGSRYLDDQLADVDSSKSSLSSALAIRTTLLQSGSLTDLEVQLPEKVYDLLSEHINTTFPITADDFSTMLGYKLLSEREHGLAGYMDISDSLSDRICKEFKHYRSFSGFCEHLKTKDFTYARISRCLMHLLLNMKTETLASYIRNDYISYARLLGFRTGAADLLTAAKSRGSLTLIGKLADAKNILSPTALAMLEEDVYASHVYQIAVASKFKTIAQNEYTRPIIKL